MPPLLIASLLKHLFLQDVASHGELSDADKQSLRV